MAMANACGLAALGIDESQTRCSEARSLRLSLPAVISFRVENKTLPISFARTTAEDVVPGHISKSPDFQDEKYDSYYFAKTTAKDLVPVDCRESPDSQDEKYDLYSEEEGETP